MTPAQPRPWQPSASRAWLLVSATLMLASVALPMAQGGHLDGPWLSWLDWQPRLAGSQVWRWWTPVAVHFSWGHLVGNVLGVLLVASLGWAARLPRAAAWAWVWAWPLTHLMLGWRPSLLSYGGASGVLHAGVAVTAVWLVVWRQGRARWLGVTTGLMLCAKVLSESPWGPVLQAREGWDIWIAPWAHATGALAGAGCALGMCAWVRRFSNDPAQRLPHSDK